MSINNENENPLGYKNEGKLLVGFAIPCIISMLVTALYNIVDQIFIGQGVGFLGNAATTVSVRASVCLEMQQQILHFHYQQHARLYHSCSELVVQPITHCILVQVKRQNQKNMPAME